jgi:alpha-galactosidase
MRISVRRLGGVLSLCLGSTIVAAPARAADTPNALGDAYIAHDTASETWTLGAGGATLTLLINPGRDYQVVRLVSASGRSWLPRPQSDTTIVVNGSTFQIGSRVGGIPPRAVSAVNDGRVLRLDVTFTLQSPDLLVTRHVAIADGTPTFEVWTTFRSVSGQRVAVSDINAFHFTIPAGTIHWLTGHQATNGDGERDSAFKRQQQDLAIGQTLTLGAEGRSSEQTVPWLVVDGARDEFYAGLMWSGAWSLIANRASTGLSVSWGLAPMSTTVGATAIDGPHALFGVAAGAQAEASAALGLYVLNGLRAGQPLTPLVTFNTWFAYGTNVDEASIRDEIERAAALGAELFVVDAGWYAGADIVNTGNFDQGLGSWVADPARFPNGLRPLSDYAHSLGIKFGLWVEPERVNLSFVDGGDVDQSWLATSGGSYESDDSAQICLASEAGRKWIYDHLTQLIDEVEPDYLKWDNNLWVNCDRTGHGHGPADGNFVHVTALYQMLDALRQRYPSLLIENCSGGGNRLDLGMLRYSDAGWMDDRTAPSVHVRHNLEGLATIFPPAYLLSFVTDDSTDDEPLYNAPDLSLYFRSRMGGALGLCFRIEQYSDSDIENMSHEIAIYKSLRAALGTASSVLLTQQTSLNSGQDWDVLQTTAPGSNVLVVYVFQDGEGSGKINVIPVDLLPAANYVVYSVDTGLLGTATSDDITANGIDVIESPRSAAHILTITAAP